MRRVDVDASHEWSEPHRVHASPSTRSGTYGKTHGSEIRNANGVEWASNQRSRFSNGVGAVDRGDLTDDDGGLDHPDRLRGLGARNVAGVSVRHRDAVLRGLRS